jgi:hypothetical protein
MTRETLKKTPLAFALFTATLNLVVAFDNSHLWGGDPFRPPRKAVEIATSTNSREYVSFEQKIRAPLTTVTASISSDGPVPSWDVTSRQLLFR